MSVDEKQSRIHLLPALTALLVQGALLTSLAVAASVQDLKVIQTVNLDPFCSSAISADGQFHARSKKGSVEVVSLATGKALWRTPLTSRSACLSSLAFSRDGLNVIGIDSTGADDLTDPAEVFYFNAKNGKIGPRFFIEDTLHTFTTSKSGSLFIGSFAADGIGVIDAKESKVLGGVIAPQGSPILELEIQRGSKVLAFVDLKDGAFVVDLDQTTRPSRLNTGTPTSIALSPISPTVMVGTQDGMLEAFDTKTQKRLWTKKISDAPILDLTFNATGTKLIAGYKDGTVAILEKNGTLIKKIKVGNWVITGLAVSDDGRQLAVTSSNLKVGQFQSTLTLFKTSGGVPVLR